MGVGEVDAGPFQLGPGAGLGGQGRQVLGLGRFPVQFGDQLLPVKGLGAFEGVAGQEQLGLGLLVGGPGVQDAGLEEGCVQQGQELAPAHPAVKINLDSGDGPRDLGAHLHRVAGL